MRFLSLASSAVLFTAILFSSSAVLATAFDDPGARSASPAATGAGLEPVKSETDGGDISVGASSQVVVLFRNTAAQPIEVGAVNLFPSSAVTAAITMNDCAKEPLPSGAECPMAMTVNAFQSGPWRIEMLVRHSGRSRVVIASVKGTVTSGKEGDKQASLDLQPTPDKVDFGTLDSGRPLVRPVVLRNISASTLNIKDISLQASSNAEYNMETNCESLKSGEACLVSLSWSPKQRGPSAGFIVIQHDGPSGVTSIPLEGKFEPKSNEKATIFPDAMPGKGVLIASEDEIDFGDKVDSEAAYTMSLVNVGDSDLEIQKLGLTGAENGLSILRNGCTDGRVLAPVEACPLTILWSPVRASEMRDAIQVVHDGARGVLVVPIKGKAEKIYNQDSKALVARNGVYGRQVDYGQVLQGFVVSSHARNRAIINGPGGSRVVADGQVMMLGGVQWTVRIVDSGVEMLAGDSKVLLLFDRSLSTGSVGGSSSTSSSSTTSSDTSTTSSSTSSE